MATNTITNPMHSAVFLDRDGVLNSEVGFITSPKDLHIYPYAAEAVKIINQSGYLAILVTNQSAVARNLMSVNDLEKIHALLHGYLKRGNACLDAIYYCPHLPAADVIGGNAEFLKSCNCRKPKAGMLTNAVRKFNINLANSFLIGDSERDIIAGKTAGCKTIGVKTGNALKQSTVRPDFVFENVLEAVMAICKK